MTNDNSTAGDAEIRKSFCFEPSRLRLNQDFQKYVAVKKHVSSIQVRKPTIAEFVRVRPEPEYILDTFLLKNEASTNELYLIADDMHKELSKVKLVKPYRLFTTINREGVLFLWPVKLTNAQGNYARWSISALEAAESAKAKWTRTESDMEISAYVTYTASINLAEPVWPDLTLEKILEIAFGQLYVEDNNHILLRRHRGEI